jgi:hypothetical protein
VLGPGYVGARSKSRWDRLCRATRRPKSSGIALDSKVSRWYLGSIVDEIVSATSGCRRDPATPIEVGKSRRDFVTVDSSTPEQ